MEFKTITIDDAAYGDFVRFRNEILRKPLGLSIYEEDLSGDKEDVMIAAYEDDTIIGCVMLHPVDNNIMKLRQMAVGDEQQGKGIGRQIVAYAEEIAKGKGYKQITMHARMTAIPFYQKLGYTEYGAEFEEVTIPHVAMQKTIG